MVKVILEKQMKVGGILMNLQELLENIFKSEEGKEKNITDFLSKISGIDKSNINTSNIKK